LSYSGDPQRKRRRIDINGDGTTGDLLPGTTAFGDHKKYMWNKYFLYVLPGNISSANSVFLGCQLKRV
jgi:hypothetical protein